MCSPLDGPGDLAQMRPRQRLALGLGPGFCREVNLSGAQMRTGKEEKWV